MSNLVPSMNMEASSRVRASRERTSGGPSVLVVEDDVPIANALVSVLSGTYEVEHLSTGKAAIDMLEDEAFDIVLLDRLLPDLSGTDVLAHIDSGNLDCRVAIISGIEPDTDIIDLNFDEYLVKPVERSEIETCIERLLVLDEQDEAYQRLHSKLATKNVIERECKSKQYADDPRYLRLLEEIDALRAVVDEAGYAFRDSGI